MASVQRSDFGALLRRHRTAAGLSQEELAERTGLSADAISLLERGVRRRPYAYTVQKLADALALAPHDRATFEAVARRRDVPSSGQTPMPLRMPPGNASWPLVGRERERALLERHLADEDVPLLLFSGEPGIGKTRLLREAVRHGQDAGWTVLEGGCQRGGGQEPYAPLVGALERHIRHLSPAQARLDLRECGWLVRLLPELEGMDCKAMPSAALPAEQERRLIFGAVTRFLANVAGPAGTLLVLDDLQWTGADALALLTTLVRAAPEVPLRVVGAYRNTEIRPDSPLSVTLADLAHAGLLAHRTLAPLSLEEAAHLLAGLLGKDAESAAREAGRLWERVLLRTGGVPFFVVSYAQELRSQSPHERVGGRGNPWEEVPWDVAQSVRQRVAALPEPAREVLRAAAVVDRALQPTLLTAVTAQSEYEVLAALEAACQGGLLAEEEDAYRFAHDLIREVVEVDMGVARRQVLHRRIAEVLEQGPGAPPIEALAFHFGRSSAHDRAAPYLEQAGDRAVAQSAFAAAERYYRALVDCLERLGRSMPGAGAREKLGGVLSVSGRLDEALAVLEQAAETYRTGGDVDSLGRVTAQIGQLQGWKGTPEQGIARLEPLLATLDAQGPSRTLGMLHFVRAQLCVNSGRYSEGLAATERAAEIARGMGDHSLLARAEMGRGNALRLLGRVAEAQAAIGEAIRLAEALDDHGLLCVALDGAVSLSIARGELEAATIANARALEIAQRLANGQHVAIMTAVRGYIAFLTGDWARARADLERSANLAHRIGASWLMPWELGRLCLAEAKWEESSRYLEECIATAHQNGDLQALRLAQATLAERDLLQGRPAAAYARLAPLLDRPGLEEWQVTELLPVLAWAHLELGEVEQAADVASRAVRRACAQGNRLSLVEALRVQGLVALRQERWDEAMQVLEEAVSFARRMRYPYGEARVLHVYGLLHARREEPEAACRRLEAALAICTRLGACLEAEQIERIVAHLR
jgi:tetratricopeptide (TPR) repeat protein/transcriptional regulator with XRE-family HTH domain